MEVDVVLGGYEPLRCPKCGESIDDYWTNTSDWGSNYYSFECGECGHEGSFVTHEVVCWIE